MKRAQIQQSIDNLTLILTAHENALIAFAANPGLTSYSLDSGQTITKVTRADPKILYDTMDSLRNQLCTLQTRLTGTGVRHVRPGW